MEMMWLFFTWNETTWCKSEVARHSIEAVHTANTAAVDLIMYSEGLMKTVEDRGMPI